MLVTKVQNTYYVNLFFLFLCAVASVAFSVSSREYTRRENPDKSLVHMTIRIVTELWRSKGGEGNESTQRTEIHCELNRHVSQVILDLRP